MKLEEKQALRAIVAHYRDCEKQLNDVQKIQETLKIRVDIVLSEIEKIKLEEQKLLSELNEKYGKEFSALELMEIINEKDD